MSATTKKRPWRHSRWCQYKGHPQDEPVCTCGHPLCLHTVVYGYTKLPPEKCRSRDCEGQCEVWDVESETE